MARYIIDASFTDIPKVVVQKAKLLVLDSLGCALGGSTTKIGKILMSFARCSNGRRESTICGDGTKVRSFNAAFVNSEMANILDFDDILLGHIGATVIPPAIAVGEAFSATGRELITAVVTGYEVSTRIGTAIRASEARSQEVCGLGSWQIFGAVSAAGKLLRLNEKTMIMALGIAGSAAPVPSDMKNSLNPSNQQVGMGMVKNVYGFASEIGVKAALLASMGYTGSQDILEGNTGFWRMAGSDQCDFEKMTERLGDKYDLLEVGFKPYSSCASNHAAIEAACNIVRRHKLPLDDIERIVVKTFTSQTIPPRGDYNPKTIGSAIYSYPYVIAVALTGERPGPKWFSEDKLKDPQVLALAQKVKLEPDQDADRLARAHAFRSYAKVEITCNRKGYFDLVTCPKGVSQNPMTKNEIQDKFGDLASFAIDGPKVKKIIRAVNELEHIKDLTEITNLLY